MLMSRTIAALLAGELDKSHTENGRLLQREGSAFGGKQLVRKTSCVFCLRTQTRAGAQPNGQARSVRCPFGLIETTVFTHSPAVAARCPWYRAKNLNFSQNVTL
jgi:hypothetical protein